MTRYWAGQFDSRAQERAINALPHFRTEIDGVPLHYCPCPGGERGTSCDIADAWMAVDVLGPEGRRASAHPRRLRRRRSLAARVRLLVPYARARHRRAADGRPLARAHSRNTRLRLFHGCRWRLGSDRHVRTRLSSCAPSDRDLLAAVVAAWRRPPLDSGRCLRAGRTV